MLLNICILRDLLKNTVKSSHIPDLNIPFSIEKCAFYHRNISLSEKTLYIVHSDELSYLLSHKTSLSLLCIGEPDIVYSNSIHNILIIDKTYAPYLLMNEVNDLFSQYQKLETKLQTAVTTESSIQSIVQIMAPFFHNELLISTDDYRLIGNSKKKINFCELSNLPQPDEDGILPPELVSILENNISYTESKNLTDIYYLPSGLFACSALCMNVFHNNEYVCRVMVVYDKIPFRSYDNELLRFFASYVQLFYALNINDSKILPRNHLSQLLYKLLEGKPVEQPALSKSLTAHNWSADSKYICLCIYPEISENYYHTLPYYCRLLNHLPMVVSIEYNKTIVSVLALHNDADAVSLVTQCSNLLPKNKLQFGVSNTFSDIQKLNEFYTQATIAIQLGRNGLTECDIFYFSDYILPYIASCITKDLSPKSLCAPELLVLQDYDVNNDTDYLHTLKLYLNNNLNAAKTAKDLFIHRATMNYRINRIKELTHIDFEDSEKLIYLRISFAFLLK